MSQQINLFNPVFLKTKKYFSAVTMAEGLGLILIGSLALFGYASYQTRAFDRQAAQTSQSLDAARAQLEKVTTTFAPRNASQLLAQDIARLELQLKARQGVQAILKGGEFGNAKGFSEYMRAFSHQSLNGLWLTGFTIQGADAAMTINGRVLQAELVPIYIKRLGQEPAMQGRTFASLEMSRPPEIKAAPGAIAAVKPLLPPFVEFSLRATNSEAPK